MLEDNCRTPSGVSYMIENRDAMLRLCPELFDIFPVRPVDSYPELLRETLAAAAPGGGGNAKCVVLTPGHFNSAFYEHSFADNMGIELVEGGDLVVDDGKVFMKTIDGPVRVDVIYRRIDDAYIDPLVFRGDSLLGVPGLIAAYLAGNVTLVNAPGTGIADDKAIYSYMPEIVRYYTGQEARLPNVETWRCREPLDLKYALDNLDKLVVKLVDGSGGYGMLVGPTASAAEIDDFRAALKAEPERYIAQPTLALSTVPIHTEAASLRAMSISVHSCSLVPIKVTIVPGGPHQSGASQGLFGGQFQPGRRHQGQLRSGRSRGRRELMLARTAASLYWIGRYMERAEFTTRLIEATIRLAALGSHAHVEQAWASALSVVGAPPLDTGKEGYGARRYLALSPDNPGSVRACIAGARDSARAARTALSREVWEAINRAWLAIQGRTSPAESSRPSTWSRS